MKLRNSPEMLELIAIFSAEVSQIVQDKAAITGAICTSEYLVAASRYLATRWLSMIYVEVSAYQTLAWLICHDGRESISYRIKPLAIRSITDPCTILLSC